MQVLAMGHHLPFMLLKQMHIRQPVLNILVYLHTEDICLRSSMVIHALVMTMIIVMMMNASVEGKEK